MSRPYLTLWRGGFQPRISTYAMFVLIDWTWLNDVCLQVLCFSSGSFRGERAFQLLEVPVTRDRSYKIPMLTLSALFLASSLKSQMFITLFAPCWLPWLRRSKLKSGICKKEDRMWHEKPLHHVCISSDFWCQWLEGSARMPPLLWASGYCRSA